MMKMMKLLMVSSGSMSLILKKIKENMVILLKELCNLTRSIIINKIRRKMVKIRLTGLVNSL